MRRLLYNKTGMFKTTVTRIIHTYRCQQQFLKKNSLQSYFQETNGNKKCHQIASNAYQQLN
jgi:hypothetical protein